MPQVKTALSAIMKTLMRFHTASIACALILVASHLTGKAQRALRVVPRKRL
jgi:hypothetical protein